MEDRQLDRGVQQKCGAFNLSIQPKGKGKTCFCSASGWRAGVIIMAFTLLWAHKEIVLDSKGKKYIDLKIGKAIVTKRLNLG